MKPKKTLKQYEPADIRAAREFLGMGKTIDEVISSLDDMDRACKAFLDAAAQGKAAKS